MCGLRLHRHASLSRLPRRVAAKPSYPSRFVVTRTKCDAVPTIGLSDI
jgi:hypothetical protein